jgi:signal transduction histidine kinase
MPATADRELQHLVAGRWQLPSARRASPRDLEAQIRVATQSPVVAALLEAADAVLLVLNPERQIVAWNERAAALRGEIAVTAGQRPGEALDCANARGTGGCGASAACAGCGAIGALLCSAEDGHPVESECVVRAGGERGTSLEFGVRATPLLLDGHRFTVLSLRDVTREKRREALEQTFFHDVLNTVAGLRGWAVRLRRGGDAARAGERIDLLSRQLEREIRDHRALALAESGALVPHRELVSAAALLRELELVFSSHVAADGRRLVVEPAPEGLALETDPSLLLRVLVNMTRNALEATPEGGEARVACEEAPAGGPHAGGALRFTVRNEGVIPPAVQARIFQRSFSTKAARGRGLGTYGMRLLGERYLGGEVAFLSTVEDGTVFWIDVPLAPAPSAPGAS